MDYKDFRSKFVSYNKQIYKKLILISILVFYFAFLFFFNYYRLTLHNSLESSWLFGILVSLIFTIILVLSVDSIKVLYNIKKER